MIDGGVSYILVHQTGLADTAVAENNNLLTVRSSRDTKSSVSPKAYLQELLARRHVVRWGAWRESMLEMVALRFGCCNGDYLRTGFRANKRVIKGGERFDKVLLFIRMSAGGRGGRGRQAPMTRCRTGPSLCYLALSPPRPCPVILRRLRLDSQPQTDIYHCKYHILLLRATHFHSWHGWVGTQI
jgi:hypothetical protein